MEKKKPNRRSVPVTITIERELLKIVDNLADAQNLTRSQFIERQIRNGIEQEKFSVAMMANPEVAKMLAKVFGSPEALRMVGAAVEAEVTEKHLEEVNRRLTAAADVASQVVNPTKKGKGKKS
jgi:hypothetical protein